VGRFTAQSAQGKTGRANWLFRRLPYPLPTYLACTREWLGYRKVSPLEFQIPSKNWTNKPPHKERYNDDDDESTAQRFQLTMTIADSNAVTTINNTTYQKSVMIGRDELETLWRSRLREVFFSIEVQVPINGVKRNCLLLQPKRLVSCTL
jgi:hypothetical protein